MKLQITFDDNDVKNLVTTSGQMTEEEAKKANKEALAQQLMKYLKPFGARDYQHLEQEQPVSTTKRLEENGYQYKFRNTDIDIATIGKRNEMLVSVNGKSDSFGFKFNFVYYEDIQKMNKKTEQAFIQHGSDCSIDGFYYFLCDRHDESVENFLNRFDQFYERERKYKSFYEREHDER